MVYALRKETKTKKNLVMTRQSNEEPREKAPQGKKLVAVVQKMTDNIEGIIARIMTENKK